MLLSSITTPGQSQRPNCQRLSCRLSSKLRYLPQFSISMSQRLPLSHHNQVHLDFALRSSFFFVTEGLPTRFSIEPGFKSPFSINPSSRPRSRRYQQLLSWSLVSPSRRLNRKKNFLFPCLSRRWLPLKSPHFASQFP